MEIYTIMKLLVVFGIVIFILILICAWIDGGRH